MELTEGEWYTVQNDDGDTLDVRYVGLNDEGEAELYVAQLDTYIDVPLRDALERLQ